jgi:phosphoenolpyruvate phosphomutase
MDEALRRAEAYHAAGADAVLIHSKKTDANEIFEFCRRWGGRAPVVIVPTTYYSTPTDLFRQAGVSTVIWANHLLRSSIAAMRQTAEIIQTDQSLREVEGRVASVKDIFRIVGNAELEEAERRYLPETPRPQAVVLAASGGDLGELTRDKPKCMIDVRGSSVLQRLLDTFLESGIRDVTVVRGYRKEAVAIPGVKTVDNDRYEQTGEAYSLAQAIGALSGELVVTYGDVLFRNFILDSLLSSHSDVVLAVDALNWRTPKPHGKDLVQADRGFSGDYLETAQPHLRAMSAALDEAASQGEWMGVARFSALGAQWLREELALLADEGLIETADMPLLFSRIAAKHPVRIKYFTGHWMDMDTLADVADARNFT